MKRAMFAAALVAPLLAACTTPAAQSPDAQSPATMSGLFDEDGYRTLRYRAPVDRKPAPAHTISLGDALTLWATRKAVFVDVLPVEGGWRDPATGRWRLSVNHQTIPGALWHPETGRGAVDPVLWRGLRDAIAAKRAESPEMSLILFCRTDCWMGWNAARRLALDGVASVYWLAEGIDGWHARGHDLVVAEPAIIAPQRP